jgi:hypothetical protein
MAPRRCTAPACYGRDADVFEMLVNVCGIDLDLRVTVMVQHVFLAAADHHDALRWLVEAGADVNVADNDGQTPLQRASTQSIALFCCLLLGQTCVHVTTTVGRRFTVLRTRTRVAAVHSLLAAGADLDVADDAGETARQVLARRGWTIDPDQVEVARRDIAKARIDLVRYRALEMCIGLQSLELDALQMCEILQFACGRVAPLIPFHIWWKIATTVKHFRKRSNSLRCSAPASARAQLYPITHWCGGANRQ